MIIDYLNYSLKGLGHRKLRSWLTMLGIFIGIATIVALISLGQGLNTAVMSQFSMLSADVITIGTSSSVQNSAFAISSTPLTEKELKAVESVSGISAAAPRNMMPVGFSYDKSLSGNGMLVSVPDGESRELVYDIAAIRLMSGDRLKDGDDGMVLLGYNIAYNDKLSRPLKIGNKITINEKDYTIKGIIEKKGSFMIDNIIAMNEGEMNSLMGLTKGEYSIIGARLKPGYDMKQTVLEIERKLRKVRNVKEETQNFTVESALDTLKMMESALFGVQLFFYIIAGISIVVGGIGISNTMFTSVLERTKEIGIMKAIGAKNSSIFILFLIESGLLGMVGGLIGVALGVALGVGIGTIGSMALKSDLIKAHFSFVLLFGSLMFSFLLGALSGIIPAMRAAKMHPVVALSHGK